MMLAAALLLFALVVAVLVLVITSRPKRERRDPFSYDDQYSKRWGGSNSGRRPDDRW